MKNKIKYIPKNTEYISVCCATNHNGMFEFNEKELLGVCNGCDEATNFELI